MTKKQRVRTWIALMLLLVGVSLYFAGRSFVFSRIERSIIAKLDSLHGDSVRVRYGSVKTNSWNRSLVITALEVQFNVHDSLSDASITLPDLQVRGIELLPILFSHELQVDAVFLDRLSIRALNNFKMPARKQGGDNFLKGIRIAAVRIDSGTYDAIDSASRETVASVQLNGNFRNLLAQRKDHEPPQWKIGSAILSSINAAFPKQFYNLNVKQVFYSSTEKRLQMDSAVITPMYNKAEFSRKAGRQIDRFSGIIPTLRATGVEIGMSPPSYSANYVTLGFRLDAFRDKRVPRKLRKPSVLPVQFLHDKPFQLQIDSLAIVNSAITYEEIPEDGDVPGKVFFKDLNVEIYNISNNSPAGATMNASTRFMKSGELRAHFTFPADPGQPYTVNGALTNFSMPEMNSMLVPSAHAEIESGLLRHMKFQFQYNDYRSDGTVELSYADLKVNALKKNGAKEENKLISFLIKLFVKEDLDKTDTKEKRTGTIQEQRNPQRGIFNYWWKSIFSGVKSLIGLDNAKKK